jgi:hypothetical protein
MVTATRTSPLASTSFESFSFPKPARHLTISVLPGGQGYAIAVRGGYRGKDAYTVRACGVESGRRGCVTVNFDVTVQ